MPTRPVPAFVDQRADEAKAKREEEALKEFEVRDDIPRDSNHDFGDQGKVDPPKVPGGDGAGAGDVAVSTDAIKTFAANMKLLHDPLKNALRQLDEVDVRPGGLPAAFAIRDKIMGEHGLASATRVFMNGLLETLVDVESAALALASKYESAEEFNKMTSADLGTYLSEVSGDVASLAK